MYCIRPDTRQGICAFGEKKRAISIRVIWFTLTAWFTSTDPNAYLQSLEKIAKLHAKRIFPAHHSLAIQPEIVIRIRDAFRKLKTGGQLHHGSGTFSYGDWSI